MFNIKTKVTAFFLSFIVLFFGNIVLITGILKDRPSDENKRIPGDQASLQAAVYSQEPSDKSSEMYSFAEELPDPSEELQPDSMEDSIISPADINNADEFSSGDSLGNYEEESYPAGFYVIGEDMPAGIYKLTASEGQAAFYRISDSIKEEYYSITDNDVFNTFTYILVEEGEYLNLIDASASPLEKAKSSSALQLENSNGKYLVGKDLPADTYNVIPDEKSGYVEIAALPIKSVSDIIFSRIIHERIQITLVEGHYIKLSSARLEPLE